MRSKVAIGIGAVGAAVVAAAGVAEVAQDGRGAYPPFVAAAYARQAPKTEELGKRFSWPALAAFKRVFQDSSAVRPVRADGSADPAGLVDARAWQDWTYSSTLMALDQPLYAESKEDDDPWSGRGGSDLWVFDKPLGRDEGLAAARKLLGQSPNRNSHALALAADFAEKEREFDLAIALRARYQPVGMCSMDGHPAEAARRYAELCFVAGRLACFLNLQVQIMGDQFERVAYSSFGEASHDTEAERLASVGIDVQRFLRGLLYQFSSPGGERRELDPWRLARSIREAKLAGTLDGYLRAEAARTSLDAENRLRAVQTLAFLRFQEGVPERFGPAADKDGKKRMDVLASIRRDLLSLGLPAAAAEWVKKLGQEE